MSALERPQLRPHLAAAPEGPGGFVIWDQLRLAERRVRVTKLEMTLLRLLDGRRTLPDIHRQAQQHFDGQTPPLEAFTRLIQELDDALFLDGPRFRARLQEQTREPIRPAACTPCYGEDPAVIRRYLDRLFTGPQGPGRPGPCRNDERFRAALLPHIDYQRGGHTYTWGFKELVERTPARLFVIIGTSHYSYHRYTLTRKHFQTPLGLAQTDQKYIDRLVSHYGDSLFDDELGAHMPEHSIELEVVFLQYLYRDTPIRIVPLVVGSFHECIALGRDPASMADISRMIEALRAADRATEEPICYIISGDLAHIGPKFGDPRPVGPTLVAQSRRQDFNLLSELGWGGQKTRRKDAPNPEAFFRVIAEEDDARRICGLPPLYTVLQALHPSSGELLHYDQYIHPDGEESVSFASLVFDR
jgi:AmmeMemoRadiSam system protein B